MKLDVFAIKVLMADDEMSILDLAKKMGCHGSVLGDILRKGSCTTKVAGKIAHALGVSVADIVIRE